MNFQLKHRNAEVPNSLKVAIGEKISRFKKLLPETAYLEIDLINYREHYAGQKEAEVVLDIPGKKQIIRFTARDTTFLAAVDRVLDKLDDEIGRIRDRDTDHSYHGQSPKEWLADEMNKEEK